MTKASPGGLRSIIDTVSAIYSSLATDKDIANAMIIHIVMSKVEQTTKSRYEEQLRQAAFLV